jgi:predicted thioredoxin/glutaredoxin
MNEIPLSLEEYEAQKVARFLPMSVRKRKQSLDSVLSEMHRFKKPMDERDKEDIKKIEALVFELYPELSERTVRDYAKTAIRIWNLRNQQLSKKT